MKYSTLKMMIVAFVGLGAEVTFAGRVEVLIILAAYAALFARDSKQGLLCAWGIGLMRDCGSVNPLGLHALVFLLLAWAILATRPFLFREHPLTQLIAVFCCVAVADLLIALFISIFIGGIPFGTMAWRTLVAALYTSVLAPVLMWALFRMRWLIRT